MYDGATASLRGRPLLLPDDLSRPERGNATVVASYSQAGRAEQAVFHAEFEPFFRRRDWNFSAARTRAPLTLPAPGAVETPEPVSGERQAGEPVDIVAGWRREKGGEG